MWDSLSVATVVWILIVIMWSVWFGERVRDLQMLLQLCEYQLSWYEVYGLQNLWENLILSVATVV